MTTPDIAGLCERLRARTKRSLPTDWQKGRDCPECGVGADRPKCMWEMGGGCPRHDPDNYEPSPYIIVPDKDAHEDANTLERQAAEIERLREGLNGAKHELRLVIRDIDANRFQHGSGS